MAWVLHLHKTEKVRLLTELDIRPLPNDCEVLPDINTVRVSVKGAEYY